MDERPSAIPADAPPPASPFGSPLRRALLLAGHGSLRGLGSAATVRVCAQRLAAQTRFATVRAVFWKEPPYWSRAFDGLAVDVIHVVPFFASNGHLVSTVLPQELGLRGAETIRDGVPIHLSPPVGLLPGLPALLAERTMATMTMAGRLDPAETAVLLIGHGNPGDPSSAQAVQAMATALAGTLPVAEVASVFLEEPPRVAGWRQQVTAPNVVVIPFLASNGPHAVRDIPIALGLDPGEEAFLRLPYAPGAIGPFPVAGHRLWYNPALGADPALPALIAAAVDGAPPD